MFTSKVNFPNNKKLVKQKVTVNEDLFIEKVEILNEEGIVEMTFVVKNTDYNPTFDESYFEVNSIINSGNNNTKDKTEDKKDENKKNEENNSIKCNPTDKNCNNSEKELSEDANKNEKNTTNNSNQDTNNKQNNVTNQANENSFTVAKPITNLLTSTMNGFEDEDEKETEFKEKSSSSVASLEDIVYPLYLPSGTVLKDQEKVSKTDGERVILTFSGDKGFTLVEETALKEKEFTIIPTFGEPGFINDAIGAITDNSLNWISNGIEYYMVSDVMNQVELLDIANSINVSAVAALK